MNSVAESVGNLIRVKAYGGEIIDRRLVRVAEKGTLVICKDEEFQAALREGRQPVCVGFPADSLVVDDSGREGGQS